MLKPIAELIGDIVSPTIKQCPFCGSPAKLFIDTYENGDTTQRHEIQCTNYFRCGARMARAISQYQNDYEEDVVSLIECWNRRTSKVAPKKREGEA